MQKTNTMAIVSVIAGALGWFAAPVLASVVAIVTGHMARSQIRASAGRQDGDGLAVAGLVLGYVSLFVGLVATVIVFMVFLGMMGLGILGSM
jgi:hypothetical protein